MDGFVIGYATGSGGDGLNKKWEYLFNCVLGLSIEDTEVVLVEDVIDKFSPCGG